MIHPKILSRLAKGTPKANNRPILNTVHFKDNYAEITDGKILIREVFKEKFHEELLSTENFKVIQGEYPDTQAVMLKTLSKPSVFKYALSKDVLSKFLATIGEVDKIIFEFRTANDPCYFKANNGNEVYGLLMPMDLGKDEPEPEEEPIPEVEDEEKVEISPIPAPNSTTLEPVSKKMSTEELLTLAKGIADKLGITLEV